MGMARYVIVVNTNAPRVRLKRVFMSTRYASCMLPCNVQHAHSGHGNLLIGYIHLPVGYRTTAYSPSQLQTHFADLKSASKVVADSDYV
jgi:hypothetical protein